MLGMVAVYWVVFCGVMSVLSGAGVVPITTLWTAGWLRAIQSQATRGLFLI